MLCENDSDDSETSVRRILESGGNLNRYKRYKRAETHTSIRKVDSAQKITVQDTESYEGSEDSHMTSTMIRPIRYRGSTVRSSAKGSEGA